MKIEIWSDVICPWCYIGKRRLEQALAQFPHREHVQIIWRSFELDPDSPRQLIGTQEELLAQKYDVTLEDAAMMNARVTDAARESGLEYRLAVARPGNTFDAHRLIHLAAERGMGDAAEERLMRAYFCEAFPVGDRDALVRLAPEFGITEQEARDLLDSDVGGADVRTDEVLAAELGITSVPYFLFDGAVAVSGAQSVEAYSSALHQAWARKK